MRTLYPIALGILALIQPLAANTIVAYVEAPATQFSSVSGVTTENFNGAATGTYSTSFNSAIGVYQGTSSQKYAIVGHDQYGGAGATGNYFAVGVQSGSKGPVLLQLNSDANYFGFWWSAGDAQNSVSFLENGILLATFTTNNLVNLLPNSPSGTVTAIDGSIYKTQNYYGNPNNTTQDSGEPFAYVDVIANGLTFNQISFANGSLGSGFESDNHSVASGVTDPPLGDVIVQNVPLTAAAQAPEPATIFLVGTALWGLSAYRFRKSRSSEQK